MKLLKNKNIIVIGLLNRYSIAYGISKVLNSYGANLAFSYEKDKYKKNITKIAKKWKCNLVFKCDLKIDKSIKNFFKKISLYWKRIDGIIHSASFSASSCLRDNYIKEISRKKFLISHSISSYSFIALTKYSLKLLKKSPSASLVAITYLGSKRYIKNYNLMASSKASLESNVIYMANFLGSEGIRVNAISSGPIKTVSSLAIKDFRKIYLKNKKMSPLKKNVSQEEIGKVVTFLCSDLSSGITGEIINVDAGVNKIGLF